MSGGRPGRGVTLAAVLAAALFPTLATWLYFVVLPGSRWMTPVYLVCKVMQFAFPLVWVLGIERAHPRLWKAPSRVGLLAGLVSGVMLSGSIYFLWQALFAGGALAERAETAVSSKLAGFGIATPGGYLLLTAFYCVVHSLLEEYYWRWFVFGHLRRFTRVGSAAVLSSLAFMAHHVLVVGELAGSYGPLTWIVSLMVALGGLVWAWLYDSSRSLYGVWLSHALVDATLLWIGYGLWRG
jgi:membrane protease YdiL (CAAX protease family)